MSIVTRSMRHLTAVVAGGLVVSSAFAVSAGAQGAAKAQPNRGQLEQRFREMGEQMVREKVGLNDEQMTKLRAVNSKFDKQRREMFRQGMDIQKSLRAEVNRGDSADQSKVSHLMSQSSHLMQKHFELMQQEQKELAGFMTPVQLAKYQGLQMQLRERMRQMMENQQGRRGGGPGAGTDRWKQPPGDAPPPP